MMRIVLTTVCCILRSWGLVIKPNFCSDFEHKVSSGFWSWRSGKIFKLEFGEYFAADVLWRLWNWILVEILKMKFDQDLGLNLWYDPIGYFGKMNSALGSVVPLAMFIYIASWFWICIIVCSRLGTLHDSIFGVTTPWRFSLGCKHLMIKHQTF